MRKKILVVEDESIIALDLKLLLRQHGYEDVSVVESGEAAVTWAHDYHPDAIIMDIQLSGEMDGDQAALQIYNDSPVPIVFLSGNAARLEHQTTPGRFVRIAKPVREDRLTRVLLDLLEELPDTAAPRD